MTHAGVKIKICGLKDADTALAVRSLPIDYIGFVFAPSKRRVSAGQAAEIIRAMQQEPSDAPLPKFVGVFVNPDPEELQHILRVAPLDCVQLHGSESPQYCRSIRERYGVPVWKSAAADSGLTQQDIGEMLEPYDGAIDALLLDRQAGGSGKTFPWEVIPGYKQWAARRRLPLIVAGGLHPGNVGQLIAEHRPDAVDVSSGVETDGVKDLDKIREFVGRVKPHVSISG